MKIFQHPSTSWYQCIREGKDTAMNGSVYTEFVLSSQSQNQNSFGSMSDAELEDIIEVDYDLNPTELYIHICESDWRSALVALERNPHEARTWVVKRDPCDGDSEEESAVRFLPLHSACARQPPLDIMIGLLTMYPQGSSIIDDNGMYPLHYACANQASAEVIGLLLLHYTHANSYRVETSGSLPIHLAAQWGVSSPDVMRTLLEANTSLACARDNDGCTPLDLALYSEDYEYKGDVLEILRQTIEVEAMNDSDDSTISTRTSSTSQNKEKMPLIQLLTELDRMQDEVEKLKRDRQEVQKQVDKQIALEWEAVNLTILELSKEAENINEDAKKRLSQARVIATIETDNGVSYDLPENPFDSKSEERDDISYSASPNDSFEEESSHNKNRKEVGSAAMAQGQRKHATKEGRQEINISSSKETTGSSKVWLRPWRNLTRRRSQSTEKIRIPTEDREDKAVRNKSSRSLFLLNYSNRSLQSRGDDERDKPPKSPIKTEKSCPQLELTNEEGHNGKNEILRDESNTALSNKNNQNGTHGTVEENCKKDLEDIPECINQVNMTSHEGEKESQLISSKQARKEDGNLEPSKESKEVKGNQMNLAQIIEENELMALELTDLTRRRNAHSLKVGVLEGMIGELSTEVRKVSAYQTETMRKLQVLEDDFKVTAAVRRANLKSMLSDLDADEAEIRRFDVSEQNQNSLKKGRKTLQLLEKMGRTLKS